MMLSDGQRLTGSEMDGGNKWAMARSSLIYSVLCMAVCIEHLMLFIIYFPTGTNSIAFIVLDKRVVTTFPLVIKKRKF